MKRANQVQPATQHERLLQSFDLREIDNPNPVSGFRLRYLARLRWLQDQIRSKAPSTALIVDIGCAQANLSLLMAEEGYRCVALDVLADSLRYARRKYERGGLQLVVGDAMALPLRDEIADVAVLAEVLEHCPDPRRALAEARRVLRPGGLLLVTTANGGCPLVREPDFFSPHPHIEPSAPHAEHRFSFSLSSLPRLIREAGFHDVRSATIGSILAAERLGWLRQLMGPRLAALLVELPARIPALRRRMAMTVAAAARK